MDTYSANSLKVLNNSLIEFKKKYTDKIELIEKNDKTEEGNKFHALICYYLKNYNVSKFLCALSDNEKEIFERIKKSDIIKFVLSGDKKYIEQPFLVKTLIGNKEFYLTGRFDCVVKKNEKIYICDWKINNLPECPENDIQTLVYVFAASKLFKTKEIEMVYYSLLKDEKKLVKAASDYIGNAENRIKEIIQKAF